MQVRDTGEHWIEVGDELEGPGIRVYIDGEDATDAFLQIVGPPMENGHGMPIPRGEHWGADTAESLVRNEALVKNETNKWVPVEERV